MTSRSEPPISIDDALLEAFIMNELSCNQPPHPTPSLMNRFNHVVAKRSEFDSLLRDTHKVHTTALSNWLTTRQNEMEKQRAMDLPAIRGRGAMSDSGRTFDEHDSENDAKQPSLGAKRIARESPTNASGGGADGFMSGIDRLALDASTRKQGQAATAYASLGARKPRTSTAFIPPYAQGQGSGSQSGGEDQFQQSLSGAPSFVRTALGAVGNSSKQQPSKQGSNSKATDTAATPPSPVDALRDAEGKLPGRLAACDPQLIEAILHEVLDGSPQVRWGDIAGLEFAKKNVYEIVVWPLLRPAFFKGLREPPKGLLLFGPPGTGKTLIGKAIATESNARFFSISASSLTSKWHGQGEKLVRTLFAVAAHLEPSVIFIDEIDSLLSQRQDAEFEASRRIKTEFLVQLDGVASSASSRDNAESGNAAPRILVVGATNRPHELDEAARRRLVKRLYVPLPDAAARKQLVTHLLSKEAHKMQPNDIDELVEQTEGYSGADLHALCKEAAFEPLRELTDITSVDVTDVRPIESKDFAAALLLVRASVDQKDLKMIEEWNATFGSFPLAPPPASSPRASTPTVE